MPSPSNSSQVPSSSGKLHTDVVTAAAELYTPSTGLSSGGASPEFLAQTFAVPTVTSVLTAAPSGTTSLVLNSSTYWTGSSPSESLDDLFQVVNAADDTAVFNNVTHLYVKVSSISGPSIGDGLYSGAITLNFNTPIPANLQFKIYYGKQGNISSIPIELATFPVIRRAANQVRFPEFDRTSLAPTSVATPIDTVNNDYPDPYMAQWKALTRGTPGTLSQAYSGTNGFVYVGRKKNVLDANDVSLQGHQASGFLAVYEKEIKATTLNGQTVLTKIDPALSATVNPTGAADILQLNVADYFRTTVSAVNKTAIRCGIDMVEVTFTLTGVKEVYIISALDGSDVKRAKLVTLGGATASFTNQAVTVRWIRPAFFVGGDNDTQTTGVNNFRGFGSLVAGSITNDPTAEIQQDPPFFAAGTDELARAPNTTNPWNLRALTWGGYNQSGSSPAALGQRNVHGELWGDGSIQSFGGRITGLPNYRPLSNVVSTTTSVAIDPSFNNLNIFSFSGSLNCVLTLTLASNYTPLTGDTIMIMVLYNGVAASPNEQSTIVWPVSFKFSGNDGYTPAPTNTVIKYQGTYLNSNFYMTRTDY